MKIFLDDIRKEPEGFILCKHVSEVIELIKENEVSVLSLDNDLGENEPEGRKVLDWIEEHLSDPNFKLPKNIIVHSANPVARQYMNTVINKIME